MKRTEFLNKLSIYITPVITAIVYLTGFSLIDLIFSLNIMKSTFNDEFIDRVTNTDIKIGLDIALLTILSMLLIRVFDLLKIQINIVNKDRTNELYIKTQDTKPKVLEVIFNIDLKNLAIKRFINYISIFKIKLYKPNGVNIVIKNKLDFKENTIDDNSNSLYIMIDLLDILDRGLFSNEVYLLLSIEPKQNIVHDLNTQISTELIFEPKDGIRCKYFFKIILFVLNKLTINSEMAKHNIRIRK